MFKDLKFYLWALKLGAVINLYFLGLTFTPAFEFTEPLEFKTLTGQKPPLPPFSSWLLEFNKWSKY